MTYESSVTNAEESEAISVLTRGKIISQRVSKCRRVSYQLAMFGLTFINYAILHATRSAWSLATSDLMDLYNFSETQVAYMNATFLFFYSLGGFFLSSLGDRYNKKKLILTMYSLIAIVVTTLGSL